MLNVNFAPATQIRNLNDKVGYGNKIEGMAVLSSHVYFKKCASKYPFKKLDRVSSLTWNTCKSLSGHLE